MSFLGSPTTSSSRDLISMRHRNWVYIVTITDRNAEATEGVGGIPILAPGYLPVVYKSIKQAGGLCITDEVQSGSACTRRFKGFEGHGVTPDIVTMAKLYAI